MKKLPLIALLLPLFSFSQSLISNADFELGNVDFTSDYDVNCQNIPEGNYCVTVATDWTAANAGWDPVSSISFDGIGGNMLHVNGDSVLNKKVWCQTVENVQPNSAYRFNFFISTITSLNTAKLMLLVNGEEVGEVMTAGTVSGSWDRYENVFNVGNNTSVDICLINKQQLNSGNDFVLDNFSLEEVGIRFPNVFIPESESGLNTHFRPIAFFGVGDYQLQVYNRWGRLVYETDNNQNEIPKWNGKLKDSNALCAAGTYFWVLTTTFNDVDNNLQEHLLNGYVQLIDNQ